jgi:hypothetical protein
MGSMAMGSQRVRLGVIVAMGRVPIAMVDRETVSLGAESWSVASIESGIGMVIEMVTWIQSVSIAGSRWQ